MAAAKIDDRERIAMIVQDRWHQATLRPRRTQGGFGMTPDTSEAWDRVTDSLEDIAGRLTDFEVSEAEHEDLEDVIAQIESHISFQLRAWAENVELERQVTGKMKVAS